LPDRIQLIGVYDNSAFSAPVEYTFDLIFSIIGANYKVIPFSQFKPDDYNIDEILAVTYGREFIDCKLKKQVHIYASEFFGKDYLKTESMPKGLLKRYKDLPIIYSGHGRFDGEVKQSQNLIETNIDIIASSFFMVSRYEEVISEVKDEHDRFPARASLAYREGFLERPVVNEYIDLLWDWIKILKPALKRQPFWPENKDFAVCLTHDVDRLQKFNFKRAILSIVKYMLGKSSFGVLKQAIGYLIKHKDPFSTFSKIVEMEKIYDFNSTFFFLTKIEDPITQRYDINQKNILREIKGLEQIGWEVGLHGSYSVHDNSENLVEEYNKLNAIISNVDSIRMHYLRFGIKDTVNILEQSGITCDCSIGFPYDAGFRSGIAFPYYFYDFNNEKKSSIIEIPLVFQEPAIQQFMPSYTDKAIEKINSLLDMVKKYNGCVSVLWHNDYFDEVAHPGYLQLYTGVLRYIQKNNGAGISCKNITDLISRR
jgi:hypothetical protein